MDLLVSTMLKVLDSPTVMVPKSSFKGDISMLPSLPAPIIEIDCLTRVIPSSISDFIALPVSVRPDPGLKKPT